MLNYIIPPIIIVIATSILIVFLFKKAQQIPEEELVSEEAGENEKKRLPKVMAALGQFWLKVLERIMHRLKLISLKFHNVSNDWFHSIREKRQRKIQLQKEMEERDQQSADEEGQISEMPVYRRHNVLKISKPLVSEPTVISPQAKMKEKNKFEDALIKRIAINPKDIEAYERLGDYYLENENVQDSMECFRQVLKLSPLNYKARLRMRRLEKLIG